MVKSYVKIQEGWAPDLLAPRYPDPFADISMCFRRFVYFPLLVLKIIYH